MNYNNIVYQYCSIKWKVIITKYFFLNFTMIYHYNQEVY